MNKCEHLFDFDIVASTDNPVMIRSVYKNQKPVTYDIPKPFKKVFTEQDLFEADCKTFGSLIGPLTNHGTSIIALISEYRQRIECDNPNEDDIKKFNLLENRLKMVCSSQSKQIDRAKIGQDVKGIPKIWKTYQPILKEDSEEVKKEKEFYNSILSDRKPYFFRYVYKKEAKKLERYMKKMNRNCDNLYNMFIKDLEKLENKTEDQIKFLNNLDRGNGFINSNCEMNRICKYLESVKRNINVNVRDNKEFDYKIFYNENIEFNEELFKEISDAITSDLKNLEAIRSKINNKFLASQDEQEDNVIPVDYIKNIKDNLITNYCSNKYELLNYCIEYFFNTNKTASKSIFWELVGDVIYEKSLEQCNYVIRFPEKDKNGDIEFLNKRYAVKSVYLEDGVVYE